MNFYGVNISEPLSQYLNSPDWGNSPLASLKNSYLMELRDHPNWTQVQQARFAWRVVDVQYSSEDTTVTRFRAYGLQGEHLAYATFGIHGGHNQQIAGGFRYTPWHKNKYYVPVDNQATTVETSGYFVTVLDLDHPSEVMAYGMDKSGEQHRCLVISFRLFPFDAERYPNDV